MTPTYGLPILVESFAHIRKIVFENPLDVIFIEFYMNILKRRWTLDSLTLVVRPNDYQSINERNHIGSELPKYTRASCCFSCLIVDLITPVARISTSSPKVS